MPRILFLLILLATSVGMTRSEPVLRARSEATLSLSRSRPTS